ncbi:MAG: hypothetical protein FJX03_03920 [Alphaproteobacteria bacterium]|nr:hypothetical protein [Alphaproteobacteria bacterium]
MLCKHCQLTTITKFIKNGRATYYCEKCQK